ncbi:MAG: thioredoxin domain-containing protein [Solirubrobacterales bacterium]|nr:thioredoxin domain-containing protein [Solirubrobacterales bacterium]
MSSRADEKQRRREERERREQQQAASDTRKQRLWLLGGVAVAAIAVVAVLALVSGGDDSPDGLGDGSSLNAAAEVDELFAGIPQDGITLGDPDAPITLVEFADLQCPFCAQFARDAIPTLVRDYVRTGDVKMDLRLLTFLGPESMRAAQVTYAAGLQDLAWQYADLFFNNQGQEGSGYVTEEFLREIGEGVDGLDVDAALEQSTSAEVDALIKRSESAAQTLGVSSTPSFFVRRGEGTLEEIQLGELSAEAVGAELDRLLDGDG